MAMQTYVLTSLFLSLPIILWLIFVSFLFFFPTLFTPTEPHMHISPIR